MVLLESESIGEGEFFKKYRSMFKAMKRNLKTSKPFRPHIPGYGISEKNEGLLSWDIVDE